MLRATYDAQAALGFLVSQVSSIESEVYAIRYADIQYPRLVPVDTTAYPWAKTVTYFTTDAVGQADWMNGEASDMPFAEIAHTKYETSVEAAKIGYRFSLEEVNQAMMIPGMNLPADKAAAARRAAEELVERVVLSGDTRKGFLGLVNQTVVPQVAVPNGAGGSPLWAQKTPAEILGDVNNALVGAWSASAQVELHDTVLLPVTQYGLDRIDGALAQHRHDDPQLSATEQHLHVLDRPAADDPHVAAARRCRCRRHEPDDHLPARPAGAEVPHADAPPVLPAAAAHARIRHPRHDAARRPRRAAAARNLLQRRDLSHAGARHQSRPRRPAASMSADGGTAHGRSWRLRRCFFLADHPAHRRLGGRG